MPFTRTKLVSAVTLAAALALAAGVSARAPRAGGVPIPQVAAPMISADTLNTVTRELSSDAYEGRGPATRAEDLTITYIIKRFKDAGLKPGNKGSWLQEVPTLEIEAKNPSALSVKAGGQTMSFAFGSDYVAGSYRAVPQTRIADAPLVFVGYGINAPELGWNDYAGIDMKGKIAVVLVNDPDYDAKDEVGLFKGKRMTYYGRWTYKYEEAARQGAAGVLIVHDTFPAAYGWQVVNSSWTGPQLYIQSADNGMSNTEANGWIQKPAAEAILKASGQDLGALTAAARKKGFKAVPLSATASFGFDNTFKKTVSRNVIGIQPGKKRPDEYVLYTGHWDHLGRCNADATGDDICNGAIDNATGIAAMVAIAEANKRAGPADRSQVFLAVTMEESGLLGSKYYAENPVYPLSKTVGGVNMDGVAPGSPSRDVQITGGDKNELTRYLTAAMKTMGLYQTPEDHPERGSYYRSDHFSFAKLGVPMFAVGRGSDWVKGGKAAGEAASEDYVQHRYHQPSDEYDPSWDWSGAVQETSLYYRLGRMLASTTDWPNWHKTDEFRAIRDKSRAGGK
ncbi:MULTISPECIES: M28 family metallopeptidase [unclassified Novosphingobium]|uniref:M28 family metallopeptidase n=1 Tax=unclassified Novosphingobium TaxID=2644732 RepID=UPI000EF008BD|nr:MULTISPECIES: M28 family metallopeptidase [unclassified Novosphingobium]HCF25478.1 peptidase M28 [Novosphingobium sp.]HQV03220.1 M28 family metallopeptidase [Novosphingobium sp.]